MPDRRRFAIVVTPLFALLAVAAASLAAVRRRAGGGAEHGTLGRRASRSPLGWRDLSAGGPRPRRVPLQPSSTRRATSTPPVAMRSSTPRATPSPPTRACAIWHGDRAAHSISPMATGPHEADTYAAVAVGDLFEWHEANDCFVRYEVTEVKADLRSGRRSAQAPRDQVHDLRVHGLQRGGCHERRRQHRLGYAAGPRRPRPHGARGAWRLPDRAGGLDRRDEGA